MDPNRIPSKRVWLTLFFLASTISRTEQKRDYYFKLHSCEMDSSFSQVCESNCTVTKKGDTTGVTVYFNILTEADSGGMTIEMAGRGLNGATYIPLMPGVSSGKADEEGYTTVLNATVPDACVYLKGNKRKTIVDIGMEEMRKHGKLPNCPAETGVYYIKDFYISPEHFPPIMPEGEFLSKGTFFGVKDGVRHECLRYKIKGSVRFKKDSLWGRLKPK